jgi:hypothetical protein
MGLAWDFAVSEKDARPASALWGNTARHEGDPTPAEIRRLCFPYRMRKIAVGNRSHRARPPARVYRVPAGLAALGGGREV